MREVECELRCSFVWLLGQFAPNTTKIPTTKKHEGCRKLPEPTAEPLSSLTSSEWSDLV
jgi:hypothetical protein